MLGFDSERSTDHGWGRAHNYLSTRRRWLRYFEDPVVAVAILDRLLHHATVLSIDGDSYRMRAHRERLAELRKGVVDTAAG